MIQTLGPYVLGPTDDPNQGIYTGNSKTLADAIPDESVDLIFTDPLYDRIDDYRWLAETAARVLKPNSACLAWVATPRLADVIKVMDGPLDYAWILHWQRYGYMSPGKAGITVITQCLWFEKGHSKTVRKMADWFGTTNDGRKTIHKWAKPASLVSKWLRAFGPGVVLDPFCGNGVIAKCCRVLEDYHWLAFEILPYTAERARQNVASVEPLFAQLGLEVTE